MSPVKPVLYGIPNCDRVKQARAWLTAHQIDYEFHDFKRADIESAQLQQWIAQLGIEQLINRKGTTWRGLSETERKAFGSSTEHAISMLISAPALIKRPLLQHGAELHTGFSEPDYQRIFTIAS